LDCEERACARANSRVFIDEEILSKLDRLGKEAGQNRIGETMRHLKAVVIVVAAVSAMAVAAAAPASAANFKSSVKSAALDGAQVGAHVMQIEGKQLSCATVQFTGTSDPSGASEKQEVAPAYSNCTAFGLTTVTVKTTGCRFVLYANTSQADLKSCTAGTGAITVLATGGFATCEVEIRNQTGFNKISYGNMDPKTEFTVQMNSDNALFEITKSTGLCPLKKAGTQGFGQYVGLTGVQADGGKANFWLE
jgi:hypothetical protein